MSNERIEQIARLLAETADPPRAADERRFMQKHMPDEINIDPAVGNFFDELEKTGMLHKDRLSDVPKEVQRAVYENAIKGETVLGLIEDSDARITLVPSAATGGSMRPRFTMALVNNAGVTPLTQIAMNQQDIKSPAMIAYLKKMAQSVVGSRQVNWLIEPLHPYQSDTGVPTHQRAMERLVIQEDTKAGSLKLNDGSVVRVSPKDASLLNKLLKDLNPQNRKKMAKVMMTDKAGFDEILGFAREADDD